jgi:hypothetical protein
MCSCRTCIGWFCPPPIIVALFDAIPHRRCRLMDCVTHDAITAFPIRSPWVICTCWKFHIKSCTSLRNSDTPRPSRSAKTPCHLNTNKAITKKRRCTTTRSGTKGQRSWISNGSRIAAFLRKKRSTLRETLSGFGHYCLGYGTNSRKQYSAIGQSTKFFLLFLATSCSTKI